MSSVGVGSATGCSPLAVGGKNRVESWGFALCKEGLFEMRGESATGCWPLASGWKDRVQSLGFALCNEARWTISGKTNGSWY